MEDRFAGKVIIPTMPETFQEWLARAFGFTFAPPISASRILPVVLITETERQRLWRTRSIILAKICLEEAFEQIEWSGVGTEEP